MHEHVPLLSLSQMQNAKMNKFLASESKMQNDKAKIKNQN